MARITPFAAWRYAPTVYGNSPGEVTAPPYDIIDPSLQRALYARHRYNIVRLILPREDDNEPGAEDRYDALARRLVRWREEGVIAPDPEPRLYISEQRFRVGGGPGRVRKGFFAALDLEESSRGAVIAHEGTLARPREDRLRTIRAAGANLSPIFFLYSDPEGSVESLLDQFENERIRFPDEAGVEHAVGWTAREDLIQRVVDGMEGKKVYIADGHHRYSAALAYWNEKNAHPSSRFLLGYFTRLESDGLVILPIHRLVGEASPLRREEGLDRLSRLFTRERVDLPGEVPEEERVDWIHRQVVAGGHTFAFLSAGAAFLSLFRLRDDCRPDTLLPEMPRAVRGVSTAILDRLVLGEIFGIPEGTIDYSNNPLEVIRGLKTGTYGGAFIPRSVSGREIIEVVEQGEILPPKTTFFYPKLRSGVLLRIFG